MKTYRECFCCDESDRPFSEYGGNQQTVCNDCLDCRGDACTKPEELGEPLPSPVRRTDTGVLIVVEDAMVTR